MRIAIVTTSFPSHPGDPSGHFVDAERAELERRGHEVVVIAPESGPSGAFGWPGVAARVRERPLRALDAAKWIARARSELARADRARRFDRVIAHWALPAAWPIAAVASAESHVEIVSHGGDVRLLAAMPRIVRVPLVTALVSRASAWRFVSAALRDQMLGKVDGPLRERVARIAIVHASPIDLPDVRDAAARKRRELSALASAHASPVAIAVARLVKSKRIDRIIEHAAQTSSRLVVVGDGPERAALEALARALGVDACFVGKVTRPEALAWIAAADVLVHASRHEGLSTVIREAEALGTRVEQIA